MGAALQRAGVAVPDDDFPHVNTTAEFLARTEQRQAADGEALPTTSS